MKARRRLKAKKEHTAGHRDDSYRQDIRIPRKAENIAIVTPANYCNHNKWHKYITWARVKQTKPMDDYRV